MSIAVEHQFHRLASISGIIQRQGFAPISWTATLLEIKKRIEAVQGEYNYCLLNRYRSGSDSMGWHADDEPEMGGLQDHEAP